MGTYKPMCVILALVSMIFLQACSRHLISGNTNAIEEGLTVAQIYNQSVAQSALSWKAPRYRIKSTAVGQTTYAGYTRTAQNEIQALFKTLDNPSIPIFIYPHVALIGDEQLIKPGYTTEFFLYKQNQFALASEKF